MKVIKLTTALIIATILTATTEEIKKTEVKRELLSRHETTAVLKSIKAHKCLGRTSLCPDKCGHSGKVAVFTIKDYTYYKKHDRWASKFQTEFHIQLSGFRNDSTIKPDTATIKKVNKLKINDKVYLDWNHNRVVSPSFSYGERQVTKLEKVPENKKK